MQIAGILTSADNLSNRTTGWLCIVLEPVGTKLGKGGGSVMYGTGTGAGASLACAGDGPSKNKTKF